jgi:integrase/recombinase XerD
VLSVIGKGGKPRYIFLPDYIASAVATLRHGATDSPPIFLSRTRNALSVNAMDRGAPVHVVQQTLGHASLATMCQYVHCKPGASSAQFIAAC